MKPVLLLALAAICYAGPATFGVPNAKTISLAPDSIVISVGNGLKQITIRKDFALGEKKIDVEVLKQNVPVKKFQLNDDPSYAPSTVGIEKRSPKATGKLSQFDILSEILKDFQGPLDATLYEKLLTKLNKYVVKGQLTDEVYEIFANVDKDDTVVGRSDFQVQEEIIRQILLENAKQQELQQSNVYPYVPYQGQQYPLWNRVLGQQYQFPVYQGHQYQLPIYQGQQYQLPINQGEKYQFPLYQGQKYQLPVYPEQQYQTPVYQGQQTGLPFYQGQNTEFPFYQGQKTELPFYQGQKTEFPIYQGQLEPVYKQGSVDPQEQKQVGRVALEGPQVLPFAQNGPGSVYGLVATRPNLVQQQPTVSHKLEGLVIPKSYLENYYPLIAQKMYGQQVSPKEFVGQYQGYPESYKQQYGMYQPLEQGYQNVPLVY